MRFILRLAFVLPMMLAIAGPASSSTEARLAEAAQRRDTVAVRALLEARADVNVPQGDGATALHWAVQWDDAETANLLVRAGANVNAANDYGVTALAVACTNRNAAIVDTLLAAGANPNAADGAGVTPLMECARTGSAPAVAALLARKASVQAAESRSGQTALMWAAAEGHAEAAKLLIEHGADVRARSKGKFTPLLFAARAGDVACARVLVEAGADVNDRTPEQGTALVVASASGREALALYLLDKGADPNAADENGITALHNAAQRGLTELVGQRFDESYRVQPANMPALAQALLTRGANVNAQIAKSVRRGPDGTPFETKGATAYFLAAVAADAPLMRILGQGGADPRLPAAGGITPLMAAARSPCTGSCEYRGANAEVNERATAAALEAVTVAVELGSDVRVTSEEGQTALHMAAFTGADAVVQFLVQKGAGVDVQDMYGETPWSMAAGLSPVLRYRGQYGTHESTAKLLLALGATPVTQAEIDRRAAAAPPR